MTGHDGSIYRICREAAGLTQEQAAEGLNCSVRSLARYESGEQHVPDDIAYQMVVLYDSQLLAVQHLRLVSHVAADLFPPVTERAFVEAAMRIFNRVRRFAERHQGHRLLEIAEDSQAVRVYSSAHHAHLIENGYRLILPNGREWGFMPGKHVFEIAARNFEPQYYADLDDFLESAVSL